ncbi:hypothetical protein PS619_05074 [Pseudomonas fluorescens]|nr:hypothetical protein PS619_05074 [Pseudomonas fluorescens]
MKRRTLLSDVFLNKVFWGSKYLTLQDEVTLLFYKPYECPRPPGSGR